MHRTASNETSLISEIPNIITVENVIIAPEQGKKTVSILSEEFSEDQAFSYPLAKGRFGYNAPRNIPISPAQYFNQSLLNFNQYFVSDADYIVFVRSLFEQRHLRSSITFAMNNSKPGTTQQEQLQK